MRVHDGRMGPGVGQQPGLFQDDCLINGYISDKAVQFQFDDEDNIRTTIGGVGYQQFNYYLKCSANSTIVKGSYSKWRSRTLTAAPNEGISMSCIIRNRNCGVWKNQKLERSQQIVPSIIKLIILHNLCSQR